MRKLLVTLAVPLLLLVVAQSALAQQRHIGLFGGVNIAKLSVTVPSGGTEPDLSSRLGPAVGAVGDLGLGTGNMLYLRLEPMWVMKGGKFTDTGGEFHEKWSYVEVPLLLRVALGSSNVRPYILAGPSVGFLLSAKETDPAGDETDVKDDLKKTSISGRGGAGVDLTAGGTTHKTHIFVEGQYELGLANVLKDNSSFGTGLEAKTNGILLTAGVLFAFNGVY